MHAKSRPSKTARPGALDAYLSARLCNGRRLQNCMAAKPRACRQCLVTCMKLSVCDHLHECRAASQDEMLHAKKLIKCTAQTTGGGADGKTNTPGKTRLYPFTCAPRSMPYALLFEQINNTMLLAYNGSAHKEFVASEYVCVEKHTQMHINTHFVLAAQPQRASTSYWHRPPSSVSQPGQSLSAHLCLSFC
jgi:hypothetical protein